MNNVNEKKYNQELSDKSKEKIDNYLLKFPEDKKKSSIIYSLKIMQEENGGYLNQKLINIVAEYLKVSKMEVYEVVSFYDMFELKEVGKYKICLCTNISCTLCKTEKIVNYIKSKLGIDFGETTKDKKFTLKEVECLGYCDQAPVMQIKDKTYGNLTFEKVDKILDNLE